MKTTQYARALALATLAGITLVSAGCAVVRGQETVGAYVDDASITTAIKAKFVEDKTVDAGAIKVETLNGTVALSGSARVAELLPVNTSRLPSCASVAVVLAAKLSISTWPGALKR